jgi:hypothetical protein
MLSNFNEWLLCQCQGVTPTSKKESFLGCSCTSIELLKWTHMHSASYISSKWIKLCLYYFLETCYSNKDIIQVKCIKDAAEQLLTKDEDIKNRWWEYFDKLFNEDSESSSIKLDISSDDLNRQFVRRIQGSEVKDALKMMKGGKAMCSDGIPIEVWRTLRDVAIVWLTKLFNLIFRSNKMPDEWRRSILVPIFKNKGNVQSCTNYRGIKLWAMQWSYEIGSLNIA